MIRSCENRIQFILHLKIALSFPDSEPKCLPGSHRVASPLAKIK